VPVPDRLVLIVDISEEIFGPTAPTGLTVAEWVHGAGHYLRYEPCNAHHIDSQYFPDQEQPWYKHVTLGMGPRGSSVRFEFLKKTTKLPPRLRLSMNPRKLQKSGFKTLIKILSDPAGPFAAKPLVQAARISQLDIAVDIVGLQTSELVAFHKKQGKRSLYVGKDGVLETINIHRGVSPSKPSGNAVVRVYDRVRERKDRGKNAPYGPADVTRIEVTKALKKPYNTFTKLLAVNDPFAEVRVGYVGDQLVPSALWAQYHALARTMQPVAAAALLGLQSETASSFAKAQKVPKNPIVAKGGNWDGWSHGVAYTGLQLLLSAGN